jgi:nucleotide-binding universal stress UspA family protein
MKFLVPVSTFTPQLAPIEHVERAALNGVQVEVVLLNVQPAFNRRVSQFTSRRDRDAFRRDRSRAAMVGAIERLASRRIPFRASTVIGTPAEAIAKVAADERVDEILVGERRRSAWLRWLLPSQAEAIAARTDVPVTVVCQGRETAFQRYVIPGMAAAAALAALLFSAE